MARENLGVVLFTYRKHLQQQQWHRDVLLSLFVHCSLSWWNSSHFYFYCLLCAAGRWHRPGLVFWTNTGVTWRLCSVEMTRRVRSERGRPRMVTWTENDKLSNYIFSIANAKSDLFPWLLFGFLAVSTGISVEFRTKKNPAVSFLLARSQVLFVFIFTFNSAPHPPSTRTEINCQK